jgi:hypothetical protein
VGPMFGLGAVRKRKLYCTCLRSNQDFSPVQAFSPSLYRLSYPGSFFPIDNIFTIAERDDCVDARNLLIMTEIR